MSFRDFPYTNYHDLNADWLLETVKKDVETTKALAGKVEDEITKIPGQITDEVTKLIDSGKLEEEIEKINVGLNYLNVLSDKKILIMGDSISDTNYASRYISWVVPFMNMCKNINNCSVTNSSVSGNKTVDIFNRIKTITDLNSYNIIIFFVGTNDYGSQTKLDSMNSEDVSTFNGAWNSLYNHVCENNPKADVYVISPLMRKIDFATKTTPLLAYIRSIYNHCINYGWHFIDAYGKRPLLTLNNNTMKKIYYEDGELHPSTEFGKIFAPFIASYLITRHGDTLGNYEERANFQPFLWRSNVTPKNSVDGDNTVFFHSTGKSKISIYYNNIIEWAANAFFPVTIELPDYLKQSYYQSLLWTGYGAGVSIWNYLFIDTSQKINLRTTKVLTAKSDMRVVCDIDKSIGCDY